MIKLTLFNGKDFWLNPDQVEHMEANPDTTLCLLSGKRILVRDSPEAVIDAIVAYRSRITLLKP